MEISQSEISEKLISKSYMVKAIRQFANPTLETRFLIHILKIKSYCFNKPTHYFACQIFGHSSFHCCYGPMYLKCAEPDLAIDCVKLRETYPKCANCDGIHTAKFTECPALTQNREKTDVPKGLILRSVSTENPSLLSCPPN